MPRYKLIEETESTIIYQHNAFYLWSGIATFLLALIGYFSEIYFIQTIVLVIIVIHFGRKFFDKNETYKKIREAEKSGLAKANGNPLSFTNPLKIKIEKT